MATIIEKIFQMHTEERVEIGSQIWLDIDVKTARDFGGAQVVKNLKEHYAGNFIHDVSHTFFTFDCNAPANTIGYANNQQICRKFARENGIKVYDVDRGIGSHVMVEEGHIYPGITAVGTDSHYNIVGAVGAFGQGMGDKDVAFAWKTGKIWFEVPETMKIIFTGMPEAKVSAKDAALKVLSLLGSKGALGKAIEFYGEIVEKMSLDGRITLSSMVTEMGGIIGFIPPSQHVIKFCEERSGKKIEGIYADKDAQYEKEIEIDVSNLEPLVAIPPSPAHVKKVSQVRKKIDTVFIGSCTNGRFEDMKAAADILKGKKIAEDVTLKIVPATREVWEEMLTSCIMKTLHEAGAIISNPGCGGCASGQIGMTGEGEVQVSTSNRNFKGKQGMGETYLVSPETAATSALTGYITGVDEI